MEGTRLFEQALGLEHPWYVEKTEFDREARRLDPAPELRGRRNVRVRRVWRLGLQGVRHDLEAVAAH